MTRPCSFRKSGGSCPHAWRTVLVGQPIRPGVLAQYPCRVCTLCGLMEHIA